MEALPKIHIFFDSNHRIYNSQMHKNCRDKKIKTVTICHIIKNKCASEYNSLSHNKTYKIILSEIITGGCNKHNHWTVNDYFIIPDNLLPGTKTHVHPSQKSSFSPCSTRYLGKMRYLLLLMEQEIFSILHSNQHHFSMQTRALFPGAKWQRHTVDCSYPWSA